jgi:hypothetical protein
MLAASKKSPPLLELAKKFVSAYNSGDEVKKNMRAGLIRSVDAKGRGFFEGSVGLGALR